MIHRDLLLAGLLLCFSLSDRCDAPDKLLASHPFYSESAGISFSPPAGWKQNDKPSADEIVSFSNNKNWALRVTRANLERPTPLVSVPQKGDAPERTGMLDLMIAALKQTAPDTQILRNEVINVDSNYVGVIVARYTLNGQTWLRQQAMAQAMSAGGRGNPLGEESGKLYYVLNLMTPSGTADDDQLAADIFSAVVDTVKLLDRTNIRLDQDDRLYRTLNLITYWNRARFEKIIVPRQYFRLLKDGKNAGYIFQEELLDNPNLAGASEPGPIAYQRTHLEESDDKGRLRQTDAGIFKYMTFNYMKSGTAQERWTRSVVLQSINEKGIPFETYGTEFGETHKEVRRVFPPALKPGEQPLDEATLARQGFARDPSDPKAPPFKMVEAHTLDVHIAGKNQNDEPLHLNDIPPFYIPQAAWHFIPRLVVDHAAFHGTRTYMFAIYNSENKKVMSLYVDKSAEQEISFAGRHLEGVTVTERLGLGGAPVVHYLTTNGDYLGSEDKEQHLVTVVATEQEILQRWPKANLTRPQPIQPSVRNEN